MGEWQHGLCSCFDNPKLCIITYFIPCYTAGKNAEAIGKNCLVWGCLSMLAPCFLAMVRSDMREQKSIEVCVHADTLYRVSDAPRGVTHLTGCNTLYGV